MILYECDICGKQVTPEEAYGIGVFPEGKPMTYDYRPPQHFAPIQVSVNFTAEQTHNQFCGGCAWKALLDMVLRMGPSLDNIEGVKGMGEALAQEVGSQGDVGSHNNPDPGLLGGLISGLLGGQASVLDVNPITTDNRDSPDDATTEEPSNTETAESDRDEQEHQDREDEGNE